MSYMDHNTAFAPAGGIQVMRLDEIDQVGGGIPIFFPVLLLYGTEIAYGAGFVAGAAVAIIAYANG